MKALRDAMMAGGFGGCTINLIAKTATASFKKAVSEAYKIKFDKGCSLYFVELSDGTGIIA
ncbi:MAG: hypothetical protein Q7T92_06910 [Lutibacter sp.]|nr:hypothetical protein [Lutibacter sp.]